MAKDAALCPFSKRMCKECAIYWGRHFELCSVRNVALRAVRHGKTKEWTKEANTKWEMPDIPDGSNIMVDIEDFIESQEV
jgi:hypothetical protein